MFTDSCLAENWYKLFHREYKYKRICMLDNSTIYIYYIYYKYISEEVYFYFIYSWNIPLVYISICVPEGKLGVHFKTDSQHQRH